MSYILTYSRWRAIHEAAGSGGEGKTMILLSGPSASGKTYFAINRLGAEEWYNDLKAETVLMGTDNFNNAEIVKSFVQLVRESGMPLLAEIAEQTDSPHAIKLYEEEFARWKKEATPEEKAKYEEVDRVAGYDPEKCKSSIRKQQGRDGDGRVSAMAWTAYLLPASNVLFDDVGDAIKNYYNDLRDVLLFTPLDHYLGNIVSRNKSSNKAEHIDTQDTESGFHQYCDWYRAVAEPDLDDKRYTSEEVKIKFEEAGYSNADELLKKFGVTPELEEGFYVGLADWVRPNMIINSRDERTGRAESAASFSSVSDLR